MAKKTRLKKRHDPVFSTEPAGLGNNRGRVRAGLWCGKSSLLKRQSALASDAKLRYLAAHLGMSESPRSKERRLVRQNTPL